MSVAQISSRIEQAIDRYRLVEDGDRILAAVSGGKDSLTMLSFLCQMRNKKGRKFKLYAAHIKTDFHCGSCAHRSVLSGIFQDFGLEYRFKDIKVLDQKRQTNCFWCSWNRRKALFEIAHELHCNKVAFGHHQDDIVETALLNLFYQAEISAMSPRQVLFKGVITIIRPLCFVKEDSIIIHAQRAGFPEQLCKCPFGLTSKRKMVKKLLKSTKRIFPGRDVKSNIMANLMKIKHAESGLPREN
ncbi:MAG: ATP-binding protein [Candidatus Omnitrophota bacterium]